MKTSKSLVGGSRGRDSRDGCYIALSVERFAQLFTQFVTCHHAIERSMGDPVFRSGIPRMQILRAIPERHGVNLSFRGLLDHRLDECVRRWVNDKGGVLGPGRVNGS